MNDDYSKDDLRTFPRHFQFGISAIAILIGVIVLIVYLLKVGNGYSISGKGNVPDMEVNGQIGDFIGGVIGTFFSLAGIFLLYLTLTSQRETFKVERFESRYFELIKMHRENVSEFSIADTVYGRACFKYMINELKFVYGLVVHNARTVELSRFVNDEEYTIVDERKYLRLSYLIMFFGIGYSSERQLLELLNNGETELFNNQIKPALRQVQRMYEIRTPNSPIDFSYELNIPGTPPGLDLETRFYPFDGHSTRLGHYYRNLFQIVKYVDSRDAKTLSEDEKYQYLKSLRATLSNQEQLLLYYNSLSILGENWNIDGLLKRYALIKNLPLGMVDMGAHPHEVLGRKNSKGKFLFETDEMQERIS